MAGRWSFSADEAREALTRRRAFRRHLSESCTPDSDLVAAETVYGELVANVIRHTTGPVSIVVEWHEYAHLCVRDWGRGFYHDFGLPESMSESGRGMFIVNALARALTVECDREGCVVRVELPVRLAA